MVRLDASASCYKVCKSLVPPSRPARIIPTNVHRRVLAPNKSPGDLTAGHVPGFFVVGWAKGGLTDIIAKSMESMVTAAKAIAQDWHRIRPLNSAAY